MFACFVGRRIFVSFVVACVLEGASGVAAAGSDSKDPSRALGTVRSQIKSIQKSLGSIQADRKGVVAELKSIERNYGKIVKSLKDLQDQEAIQTRKLEEIDTEFERLRLSIKEQSQMVSDELRSAFTIGRANRLKLVLNQQDPNRINRLLVYYDYISRARVTRLSDLRHGVEELDFLQNEHIKEVERLNQLLQRKTSEQQRLDELILARQRVLAKLDKAFAEKGAKLTRLKENERRLIDLVASIQRRIDSFPSGGKADLPFHKARGNLAWPTQGKLAKQFGSQRVAGKWQGVVIEADEGTPVKAVSGGHVVYADWLRGYGLLSILDHGNGYMTLYAFNQSLYKEVGDWAEQGEVIASVGRSGGRVKPGLYFEIRMRGKPMDPAKWCRERRGRKVG